MDKDSRAIIEEEIERLEKAYVNAQDRYAFTGSRSTENTMHKYSTLINALEKAVTNPSEEVGVRERRIKELENRIHNAQIEIRDLVKSRELMVGYGDKLIRILDGDR